MPTTTSNREESWEQSLPNEHAGDYTVKVVARTEQSSCQKSITATQADRSSSQTAADHQASLEEILGWADSNYSHFIAKIISYLPNKR